MPRKAKAQTAPTTAPVTTTTTEEFFKVSNNIPLPPKRGEDAKKLDGCLNALKQGENFLIPGKLIHTLKNRLSNRKGLFSVRKEEPNFRIWKR
jgi:hypothetical protein